MNKIKIISNNPDISGTWNKYDVEQEMREIGADGGNWIEYILEMNFSFAKDDKHVVSNIIHLACNDDTEYFKWRGYIDDDKVSIEIS